jgi:hypothetical protein
MRCACMHVPHVRPLLRPPAICTHGCHPSASAHTHTHACTYAHTRTHARARAPSSRTPHEHKRSHAPTPPQAFERFLNEQSRSHEFISLFIDRQLTGALGRLARPLGAACRHARRNPCVVPRRVGLSRLRIWRPVHPRRHHSLCVTPCHSLSLVVTPGGAKATATTSEAELDLLLDKVMALFRCVCVCVCLCACVHVCVCDWVSEGAATDLAWWRGCLSPLCCHVTQVGARQPMPDSVVARLHVDTLPP